MQDAELCMRPCRREVLLGLQLGGPPNIGSCPHIDWSPGIVLADHAVQLEGDYECDLCNPDYSNDNLQKMLREQMRASRHLQETWETSQRSEQRVIELELRNIAPPERTLIDRGMAKTYHHMASTEKEGLDRLIASEKQMLRKGRLEAIQKEAQDSFNRREKPMPYYLNLDFCETEKQARQPQNDCAEGLLPGPHIGPGGLDENGMLWPPVIVIAPPSQAWDNQY